MVKGYGKYEEIRFHPISRSLLIQEIPYRSSEQIKKSKAVLVQVDAYDGDIAYCSARYLNNWLPIKLNRKSLEECNLMKGDYFEWVPSRDGIVRLEDITNHSRECTPEQMEEISRSFKSREGKLKIRER